MTPIIVLNWNGIEDTIECVQSLLKLREASFKIYLVDNGSEIDQVQKLKELYEDNEKVVLQFNKSNLAFCKAHIKVYYDLLKFEESEYIALINNDTVVDELWLKEILEFAHENEAHLVSSKLLSYYKRDIIDNTGHKMLNTGEILPIGHGENSEAHNQVIENLGPCAGACIYSKKMIDEIGFFDPYFSTGYEDAEFGLRAIIAGYKSLYDPNAIVYHKMGQSVKKIFNFEYTVMIQTSIFYTYFKNIPGWKILLDLPFFIAKNLIILVINILFWRIKFLKVHIKSWISVINIAHTISGKRKETKALRSNTISTWDLYRRMEFFLWFDIKRFWKIFILRESSAIDSY